MKVHMDVLTDIFLFIVCKMPLWPADNRLNERAVFCEQSFPSAAFIFANLPEHLPLMVWNICFHTL